MKTFLEIRKLQAERALREKLEQLVQEEGDTNFVAIIIIIVILIAIAGIFREKLTEAVEAVFEKLMDFIG
ncbi:MAG: hypothetical protein NC416_02220 [Eubacterium sp.]|nr:hypothetical protein [Eubacterium sp.]